MIQQTSQHYTLPQQHRNTTTHPWTKNDILEISLVVDEIIVLDRSGWLRHEDNSLDFHYPHVNNINKNYMVYKQNYCNRTMGKTLAHKNASPYQNYDCNWQIGRQDNYAGRKCQMIYLISSELVQNIHDAGSLRTFWRQTKEIMFQPSSDGQLNKNICKRKTYIMIMNAIHFEAMNEALMNKALTFRPSIDNKNKCQPKLL